jgi:hypothetical protein
LFSASTQKIRHVVLQPQANFPANLHTSGAEVILRAADMDIEEVIYP